MIERINGNLFLCVDESTTVNKDLLKLRARVRCYGEGIFYLGMLNEIYVGGSDKLGLLLAQFKHDIDTQIYSMTLDVQPSLIRGCWLICHNDGLIDKDKF